MAAEEPPPYADVPLFEVEPQPVPEPAYRPPMPPGAVRWTPLAPTGRSPCDDCMALHVECATAPLARRAHYRRVQGGVDRLLCYEHARIWRENDGKKPLSE